MGMKKKIRLVTASTWRTTSVVTSSDSTRATCGVPDDGTGRNITDLCETGCTSDFTRPRPKRVLVLVPHPDDAVCAAVASNVNNHDGHEAEVTWAPAPANKEGPLARVSSSDDGEFRNALDDGHVGNG